MSPIDTTERARAICGSVGFDIDQVEPWVVARMGLLAEHSETIRDCERMVVNAHRIFRHYETAKTSEIFSEAERQIVVLGCLFSDIGKTGPAAADPNGQRMIVEMFAVEGVHDETQPVTRFFRTSFPADFEERIRQFVSLGLDPEMSIREFWNLHSAWTFEILEGGGVPPEVVAAATTHHLLDNVNPDDIVASDFRFTRSFGDNAMFDRAEKLIIVLDKYDAARRRGGRTHDQAVAWLRHRIDQSARFRNDGELTTLVADLDAAVRAADDDAFAN